MKTAALFILALTTAACGGPKPVDGDPPTIQLADGTATLRVTVAGIRSSMGTVSCGLFNGAEGFPGPSPIIGGARHFPANGGSLLCLFEKLPAGTYAVSAIHDENGNGYLDTNVVGKPTEGYGSTNNVTHPTSGPTFAESSVEVKDGEDVSKTINLNY